MPSVLEHGPLRFGLNPNRLDTGESEPLFSIFRVRPLSFACLVSVSAGLGTDSGVSIFPDVVAVVAGAFGEIISRSVTTTLSSRKVSPTNSR